MRNILLIVFFLPLCLNAQSEAYKKMLEEYYTDFPTISLEKAYEHLQGNSAYFLDVRQPEEFEVSRIRGARRVQPDGSDIEGLKIKKDALIIVYCSVGARSQGYGEKLRKAGFTNVYNLYGGLFHWHNSGYAIVNSKGVTTERIHGFGKEWGKWITRGKIVY